MVVVVLCSYMAYGWYVHCCVYIVSQIIHSQVVDTAIVFPHRMGLPYKRALKTLAKEYLHKFIQNDVGKSQVLLLHIYIFEGI